MKKYLFGNKNEFQITQWNGLYKCQIVKDSLYVYMCLVEYVLHHYASAVHILLGWADKLFDTEGGLFSGLCQRGVRIHM